MSEMTAMSIIDRDRALLERVVSITFDDGFSMIKGSDYWIGSDSCEYDDPFDYLGNGSPVEGIFVENRKQPT